MTPEDIKEFVGLLLGSFALGYVAGALTLYLKKALGMIG